MQEPPWITQSSIQSKELLTCCCQPSGLPLLVVLCGFIKWSYLAEWPNLKLTLSILMFLPQLQSIICHRLLDTFFRKWIVSKWTCKTWQFCFNMLFNKGMEWLSSHFYKMRNIVKRHNFANTRDLFAFVPDFFRMICNSIYCRISRFDLTLRKNQFEGKNAKFTFHAFQLKPLVMHTQTTT